MAFGKPKPGDRVLSVPLSCLQGCVGREDDLCVGDLSKLISLCRGLQTRFSKKCGLDNPLRTDLGLLCQCCLNLNEQLNVNWSTGVGVTQQIVQQWWGGGGSPACNPCYLATWSGILGSIEVYLNLQAPSCPEQSSDFGGRAQLHCSSCQGKYPHSSVEY